MSRIPFESVHVDPDDTSADVMRRRRIPLWKIILGGVLAAALVAGIGVAQRVVFAEVPPPTLAETQAAAAQQQRNIVLVFHSSNSRVREQLLSETFGDDAVRALLDRDFIVLHLDRTIPKYSQHLATYEVRRTPTIVVTDASGAILRTEAGEAVRHVGNIGPASFVTLLSGNHVATGDVKEVKTSTRRLVEDPARAAGVND